MKVEELIKYRDQFNDVLLKHQSKTKKWIIISIISLLLSLCLIFIPLGIFGDNNGLGMPLVQIILLIIGLVILGICVVSTTFYLYHKIIIEKNKHYKEVISHELTLLIMKKLDHTDKEFKFIKWFNRFLTLLI